MKTKSIITVLVILFEVSGMAQNQSGNECGTDAIHQRLMQTDSVYKAGFLSIQNQIQTHLQNKAFQKMPFPVYTVPVVVHVIHLGEPVGTGTNISYTQIQGAIDGLNDRFKNNIGAGLDTEINFCLAVRDPNGCCTTGINRVDGSGIINYSTDGITWDGSCGATEQAIKNLSKWPQNDYYNIWVVNNICGNVAGYAYYPSGSNPYDGTVIDRNYMTYSSSTLTHEVGHGLFLAHTFEGDGGDAYCPDDFNCTNDGDWICDTPPHKSSDCGITNPCTGGGIWNNSRYNYMSYCFPSIANARFTQGQKDRMQTTMITYPRSALLNSQGCAPCSTYVITLTASAVCGQTNGTATASVNGGTSPYTYQWSNGATTQTISNLSAGNYSITVTSANGCSITVDTTINQSPALSASISTNNISCFDDSNSTATLNVTGGSPTGCPSGFSITIGTGSFVSANTTFPAPYGNYYWGARHQMLFLATELQAQGFTKGVIKSLEFNIASISGTTNYNNFEIKMGATSLTAIASFQTGLSSVFGPQNISITTGWNTHTFTSPFVWDGVSNVIVENCFNNTSFTVNSPTYYTPTSFTSVVWKMNDASNVCADNIVTGTSAYRPNVRFAVCDNTAPFTYLWSNGQTDSTATNLSAGSYTVTATDTYGCMISDSANIPQLLSVSIAKQDACYFCDGSAIAVASGGTAPYLFNWSNGATSSGITVLCPDTYFVTITDNNSCVDTDSMVILQQTPPPAPLITQNGSGLVCSAGSMSSYEWFFNGNPLVNCIADSCSCSEDGVYTVTITDANACTASSAGFNATNCIVGIGEQSLISNLQWSIFIYPNPNSGLFTVEIYPEYQGLFINYRLKIYNILGEKIYQTTTNIIDISSQPAGLYYCEIFTNGKTGRQKIIVTTQQ